MVPTAAFVVQTGILCVGGAGAHTCPACTDHQCTCNNVQALCSRCCYHCYEAYSFVAQAMPAQYACSSAQPSCAQVLSCCVPCVPQTGCTVSVLPQYIQCCRCCKLNLCCMACLVTCTPTMDPAAPFCLTCHCVTSAGSAAVNNPVNLGFCSPLLFTLWHQIRQVVASCCKACDYAQLPIGVHTFALESCIRDWQVWIVACQQLCCCCGCWTGSERHVCCTLRLYCHDCCCCTAACQKDSPLLMI